ncbi:hypothetical protein LIA77_04633 [Sarocladium implicatum]|nr:hypothetical protein LIA77_04633 [Sarocladium implicatum]
MSVEIYVDGFNGRPMPTGSLVRGRVRVKLSKPEQAQSVHQVLFAFYGHSSVQLTRREQVHSAIGSSNSSRASQSHWRTIPYESDCLLFNHRQILAQHSLQMPAAGDDLAVEFPFKVRIPTHAEPQTPESLQGHGCQPFHEADCFPGSLGYYPPSQVPRPQPLPDSFVNYEAMIHQSSDVNTRGNADVLYTLHATVPELAGSSRWIFGSSGPPETTVDIPLVNPVSLTPRPVQYKTVGANDTIRTLRLLPGSDDKRRSFRDSMRSIFKKDSLPWLNLGFVFKGPELLFLDQPDGTLLPFSFGVRRLAGGVGEVTGPSQLTYDEKGRPIDPGHIDHIPTPPVYLKSLKLKLVAHTVLRAGYDHYGSQGPRRFETFTAVTFFKYKASSSAPQIELPVGQHTFTDLGRSLGANMGDLWSADSDAGLGGLTGEFLTPNVWRRWGVEWDVKVVCAEEEVHWESETEYGGGMGIRFLRGDGASMKPPVMQHPPSPGPPMPAPAYEPPREDLSTKQEHGKEKS